MHLVIVVPFKHLTKHVLFLCDCFSIRSVPPFTNKSKENRTKLDIILLLLARPADKHGITLVHIANPSFRSLVTGVRFSRPKLVSVLHQRNKLL